MKVYAAVANSWDGIEHIVLFTSEHLAKSYVRSANRKEPSRYEISEMIVFDTVNFKGAE